MNPRALQVVQNVIRQASREQPADSLLRMEMRGAQAPRLEHARVACQAVNAYYRWQGWLNPGEFLNRQVRQAMDLEARFNTDANLIPARELRQHTVPGWLAEEMEISVAWLKSLQETPKLWLRARPGKAGELAGKLGDCVRMPSGAQGPITASNAGARKQREQGLVDASRNIPFNQEMRTKVRAPAPSTPEVRPAAPALDALQYTGEKDLFRTPEFQRGEFEIQDLGSQLVGLLCDPQFGEKWWDACAGEGGKMLHLADLMQNQGLIWASDRADWRLQKLRRRAARARVFNYRAELWDGSARLPTKTRFDGILMDAPCSGVGTWQRNPQARWTTTADDVQELAAKQLSLLSRTVPALKPGGRLVYAVCTLTRQETNGVAGALEALHPELEPLPAPDPLRPAANPTARHWFWPQEFGGNGMFVALWRKR